MLAEAVGGTLAELLSTLAVHPIDVVQTGEKEVGGFRGFD
jgi:hypothetical protein